MSQLERAREQVAEAERLLKPKGWLFPKADKPGAAAAYEKAANIYKAMANKKEAAAMFGKAVEIYGDMGDHYLFKMATLCESAAQLIKDGVDPGEAATYYDKAAFYYTQNGTNDGARDALSKAVEIRGLTTATLESMCSKLIGLSIDDEHPDSAISPAAILVRHYVSQNDLEKSITAVEKLIEIKENGVRMSGLYKDVVALCLLQLGKGDFVAATLAQRTYMRINGFLESEECGALDRLLQSYDESDQEAFTKHLDSHIIRTLPKEIYAYGRKLKVPGGKKRAAKTIVTAHSEVAPVGVGGKAAEEDEDDDAKSDNSDL